MNCFAYTDCELCKPTEQVETQYDSVYKTYC